MGQARTITGEQRAKLMTARDEVRTLWLMSEDVDALLSWCKVATISLDQLLMEACPHDPASYLREPARSIAGAADREQVHCPECDATRLEDIAA